MTELRAAVVLVCRRLWEQGLVAGRDGNVSVRIGPDRVLATPSGFSKVDVTPEDLIVVDRGGKVIEGAHEVSSEIAVHLRAYERRPDVGAVVHAHPTAATALGLAGETLPDDVLPEITVLLGPVPLVSYATPGTTELADRFDGLWQHDTFLMANHGALTLGSTLRLAHQRMETLEHAARTITIARTLGSVQHLPAGAVAALRASRERGIGHG